MSRASARVTLVTHYFPQHRGGVELVAGEIASRVAGSGRVDITWHASGTDPAPAERPGLRHLPAATCNVIERRLGLPYPLWSPAALIRLVRGVRDSDIVHLHDFLYLPNLVAWAAARLSRRPVIVTQHIGAIPFRNSALRLLLGAANRVLGKLVLGSAARTFFVSQAVLDYFRGFVRFRSPPLLLPNGVDSSLFVFAEEERRQALRAGLGVERDTPLLLFVGRFVEKKGLPMLHQLCARLPNARWIFIGRGPQDPARWGLRNVQVKGDLPRDALVPLYQAADLLVLPSFGEGFPLVVQEAMACGTPALISTDTAAGCPAAAGVLAHESLAEPAAVERWATRIAALLAGGEAVAARRRQSAEFARSAWSWERCAETYARALLECSQDARR
jgi:phosphatidylinositol alpha-1,6-mannosyltransferase